MPAITPPHQPSAALAMLTVSRDRLSARAALPQARGCWCSLQLSRPLSSTMSRRRGSQRPTLSSWTKHLMTPDLVVRIYAPKSGLSAHDPDYSTQPNATGCCVSSCPTGSCAACAPEAESSGGGVVLRTLCLQGHVW